MPEQVPETRYSQLGEDLIAFQVLGDGPVDLVFVPAMVDCIDLRWDYPPYATFQRRLASFSRLIMFDRCGSGASDSVSTEVLPSWERWAEEALAVMDAVGSRRAAIFGCGDSGPTALLFAALQPERTQSLILGNTAARFSADEGYPGVSQLSGDAITKLIKGGGTWSDPYLHLMMPDASRDPEFRRWNTKTARLSMRPRDLRKHLSWLGLADVRDLLPSIRATTLVIHRENSAVVPIDQGRYVAEHIPDARLVIVPGTDAAIWSPPADEILDSIAEFLTGARSTQEPDRAMAAILFTDIVGSTEQAAALGDRRWRSLLESHDAVVRAIIDQHRGRLVKLTGDGVLATFDGPGRAIQCALGLRDALFTLGLRIRAGLHAGEVELRSDDIGGIGVHVAARVLEQARSEELLVSAAVPLLVAGSGIEFEDRGEHDLKGLPGSWKLYAVQG